MRLIHLFVLIFCSFMPAELIADILPPPKQVAPNCYVWIGPYGPPTQENQGFRMNLGFVVGTKAVAVIDSGYSDAMAKAMLVQIRSITDRPVRYVINTNSQPHRILGNSVIRDQGARIVVAKDAIPRIIGEGQAMADTATRILQLSPGNIQAPSIPDTGINEPTNIDLGSITLKVIPVGTAHTAGSMIVKVIEHNVIYAGDVLYGGRLLAVLPVSHVDKWISAIDKLRIHKEALFIPGHGIQGKLSEFENPTYSYLVTLKEHMDKALDSGTDLQAAIESLDQTRWKNLADFDALAGRNAHQTYIEREMAAFE